MRPFALLATLAVGACSDSTGPDDNLPATGNYRVTAQTTLGQKVWDFTINSASETALSLTFTAGDLRTNPLEVTAAKSWRAWRAQFLGTTQGTNIVLIIFEGGATCEGQYVYTDGNAIDSGPWTSCALARR